MRKSLLIFLVAIFATSIAFADNIDKLSISTQMFLDEQAGRITFEKPEVIKRSAKAKGMSEKLAQDFARIAARPIASPIKRMV